MKKLLEVLTSLNLPIPKSSNDTSSKIIVEIPIQTAESKKKIMGIKGWSKGPIPLPEGFDKLPENFIPGFGCLKGMFEMSPDFDEPLEDFKEYMY